MDYSYEATYSDAATRTEERTQYSVTKVVPSLGVALRPIPSLRLALAYQPLVEKKFKSKTVETETDLGTNTRTEVTSDDLEI